MNSHICRIVFEVNRRRDLRSLFCIAMTVVACSACSSLANAVLVHDLAADFTLSSNPSGGLSNGWGYNNARINGGGPVGPAVTDWNALDFGAGQPGWVGNFAGAHAGWAELIQNPSAHDVQIGDIVTHAPTSITWHATAATAGIYNVDISMWMIRDLNRHNNFEVFENDLGSPIASGTVDNSNSSRAAPVVIPTFQANLAAGEFLRLDFLSTGSGFRDFMGVNFTLTAIPEPSAILVGLVGLCGLAVFAALRRKRSG